MRRSTNVVAYLPAGKGDNVSDEELTNIAVDSITVSKRLFDYGVVRGLIEPAKVRFTIEARRERVAELAASGLSQRQIAAQVGVTQPQVKKDLDAITELSGGDNKVITPATRTRQENEHRRKAELETPPEIDLEPGLHLGDFRELSHQIADDSVQLVFTDPPYDEDSVALYRDAAAIAARILKPGGSFIAYSGQKYLPDVLKACSYHLRYWWTIAGVHAGGNQMLQRLGIRCGWKPLVWFVKDTRGDVQNVLMDVVTGSREKDIHEWQQAEEEAAYYIEKLTSSDGLVVDFFVGGGTTIAAAKKLGRKYIGFEIDIKSAERASQRISEAA